MVWPLSRLRYISGRSGATPAAYGIQRNLYDAADLFLFVFVHYLQSYIKHFGIMNYLPKKEKSGLIVAVSTSPFSVIE